MRKDVKGTELAMQEIGDRVGSVVTRLARIECPRTRSALVVFDDGLADEQNVSALVHHLERLCGELDEDQIGQRAQLEQFTADLRRMHEANGVRAFRLAYAQRRKAGRVS
jgi:hypothetical protein